MRAREESPYFGVASAAEEAGAGGTASFDCGQAGVARPIARSAAAGMVRRRRITPLSHSFRRGQRFLPACATKTFGTQGKTGAPLYQPELPERRERLSLAKARDHWSARGVKGPRARIKAARFYRQRRAIRCIEPAQNHNSTPKAGSRASSTHRGRIPAMNIIETLERDEMAKLTATRQNPRFPAGRHPPGECQGGRG